jgi:hypothetical protein
MGNINKTIEQLEDRNYGVANPDEISYLEWRVYTLPKKIVTDFTTEDLSYKDRPK